VSYRNPFEVYQNVSKEGMNGPQVEAEVLTKAALRLKEIQDDWGGPDNDERLYAALRFNQKLWSIFQAELTEKDHAMPKALRLNLLRLSAVVDRRTYQALAFPDPDKLTMLIDINNNIAAGLRQQAEEAHAAASLRPGTVSETPGFRAVGV
jgi:flagellar protein FlaF